MSKIDLKKARYKIIVTKHHMRKKKDWHETHQNLNSGCVNMVRFEHFNFNSMVMLTL